MFRKGRALMRLDFLQRKHVLLLHGVFVLSLVVAIIIGATGPKVLTTSTTYAYLCGEDGDHLGKPCIGGVQLGTQNASIMIYSPFDDPLNSLNQLIAISMAPYANETVIMKANISILAYGLAPTGNWILEKKIDDTFELGCERVDLNYGKCEHIALDSIAKIDYVHYRWNITLTDVEDCSLFCLTTWLRDVEFTVHIVEENYTELVLAFQGVGTIISVLLFCVYLYKMRDNFSLDLESTRATHEQKWMAIILVALIFFNEPFYSLRFIVGGFLLQIIGTAFEVLFEAILLIFWLDSIDRISKDELQRTVVNYYLPKIGVVTVWAILYFSALTWLRSQYQFDPLIKLKPLYAKSIYPMITFCEVFYFLIIVWIVYLIIASWLDISSRRVIKLKFLQLSFSSWIYVLSLLIGMFSGITNDVLPTSTTFVYYFVLHNAYVYTLLFVYWPVNSEEKFASNPVGVEGEGEGEDEGETKKLVPVGSSSNPFS